MKKIMQKSAALAAACFISATSGWAADDIIFGGLGDDFLVAYSQESNVLVVLGNDADNRIEVAPGDRGCILINNQPAAIDGRILSFREMPLVAVHGGPGNDVLVGYGMPKLALVGGRGNDVLGWDNGGAGAHRVEYNGDVILWTDSPDREGHVYGGAGLDILIGNTGGDRVANDDDAIFGDLGNDWIVGGTGVDAEDDDVIGGWGNDWISGGTDSDSSLGGWGNDLLNADDVMTLEGGTTEFPEYTGGVFVATGDLNY